MSQREPKVSQREPKGAKREPKGAKREPKGDQNASKNPPTHGVSKQKSADPWSGVLESQKLRGEFTSPYPLRPGPLAAEPWSQYIHSDSIRILGPYFGPKGPNPAPGG